MGAREIERRRGPDSIRELMAELVAVKRIANAAMRVVVALEAKVLTLVEAKCDPAEFSTGLDAAIVKDDFRDEIERLIGKRKQN